MLAFKPTAKITDHGKKLRFEADGLGFDVCIKCHYIPGRVLQEHAGFKVGDRVKLNTCYKRYDHFAIGLTGVIKKIQMFSFAIFFLELDDKAHTSRVVDAHKIKSNSNLIEGQDPEHLACQCFHIYSESARKARARFSPEL